MKSKLVHLVLSLLFAVSLSGYAVAYDGDLSISSQEDVNNVSQSFNKINGGINITYASDITDLSPLSHIDSITGDLVITSNSGLTTLNGLGLEYVGGKIEVMYNGALTSIEGLMTVKKIGSDLRIRSNTILPSLTGLDSIKNVPGELYILYQTLIPNLNGLHNITSIGYGMIMGNDSLTNLVGLESLAAITGGEYGMDYLDIRVNENLESLDGLYSLNAASVVTKLYLYANPNLYDYCAVDAFVTAGGTVEASNNLFNATSANFGAGECEWADYDEAYFGSIEVTTQAEIDALATALVGKTVIGGDLIIGDADGYHNASITDLSVFQNITKVSGKLMVQNNDLLQSLDGLDAVNTVDGVLWVQNNMMLTDLCAISNLRLYGDILGDNDIRISFNYYNPQEIDFQNGACAKEGVYFGRLVLKNQAEIDNVRSIIGNATTISGSVIIGAWNVDWETTGDITNLDSLAGIVEIGDSLMIEYNKGLLSLEGLAQLSTIGGQMNIVSNPSLESLTGLENLSSVGSYIYVNDNQVLYNLCPMQTCVAAISEYASHMYNVSGNLFNPTFEGIDTACMVEGVDQMYLGDLSVTSQQEMDALVTTLAGKSIIAGDLTIGTTTGVATDIDDLSALASIKVIKNDLNIKSNVLLTSLDGLDSLQEVGWNVSITGNSLLIDYCALTGFSFPDDGMGHGFNIYSNGYDANSYDFANTCLGELPRPELTQPSYVPEWQPGAGGQVVFPTSGATTADFTGFYVKENIYSVFVTGSVEIMFGDYLYGTVEASLDGVTWSDFMDNRSEPAVISSTVHPVITPDNDYYYRLRNDAGEYSNVVYIDESAYRASFTSTGFSGDVNYDGALSISAAYRTYDGDTWTNAADNSLLEYQWYRVDPNTYEFEEIVGATSSSYEATATEVGYKVAATVKLDTSIDNVQHYCSRTYISDVYKKPVKAYISEVMTTGFDLRLYECVDTMNKDWFSPSFTWNGGYKDADVDTIIQDEDSCGIWHVYVDVPEATTSIMMWLETGDFPLTLEQAVKAGEMSHGETLMWDGTVGFYEESVIFTTQSEIDAAAALLAGYKGISGDLIIGSEASPVVRSADLRDLDLSRSFAVERSASTEDDDPIVDLSPLAGIEALKQIAGNLIIINTKAPNLEGLDSIAFVSGNVTIKDNSALASLGALAAMYYADTVTIANNPLLIDYNGLSAILENIEAIEISDNLYNPDTADVILGNADTTVSIIYLSGDLAFGSAMVGTMASVELSLYNSGNKSFTISGVTAPDGFTADWSGGTVAAGSSQSVTLEFAPQEVKTYTGVLTFEGDFDLGDNTLTLVAVGVDETGIISAQVAKQAVYPNPFTNELVLLNAENVMTVSLLSSDGQVVLERTAPVEVIETSSLEAGMYILKATYADGQVKTNTIIKQ